MRPSDLTVGDRFYDPEQTEAIMTVTSIHIPDGHTVWVQAKNRAGWAEVTYQFDRWDEIEVPA